MTKCCSILAILLGALPLLAQEAAPAARAAELLRNLVGAPPAELVAEAPRQVAQSPHQLYDCQLPPVWYAKVSIGEKEGGYLMWETTAPGRLAEFSLDPTCSIRGSQTVGGVPNLQQFPVAGKTAPLVASGCVPTAAANLVGYWAKHGFERWLEAPETAAGLQSAAQRLRARLPMTEMADDGGYTDDGTPLSGAPPDDLAAALRKDAAAHEVKAEVKMTKFSPEIVKREVAAQRPVLLSCEVRLPHKPHLSWGHEVTGLGWVEIEGDTFIGIRDNFYPGQSPDAIRWIREDFFESALTVVPRP